MILILSHPEDDHARGVVTELGRRRYPATIVDSSQFPIRTSLSQTFSTSGVRVEYSGGGRCVDLGNCRAAWWRRPLPHTLHDELDPGVMSFAYTECHEAFVGALALLNLRWVNPPHFDERAHHKPLQLATALRVGLAVPRTLVTNDPDEARRFVAELGCARTIYKTFLATEEHWRETRLLRDAELQQLEAVRLAPVIFQEYVPADADVRVTIIGDQLFATAIRADIDGYSVDYRMDMAAASFAPTALPEGVVDQLRVFMKTLGLVYGAVDMRRTPDGRYVFLEVNPAGEWRFVEERTAQPITAAMADLLIRLDSALDGGPVARVPRRSRPHRVPA